MVGLNDGNSNSSKDGSWIDRMKHFYDETMEPLEKKPCDGARNDFKECLMLSDCYLKVWHYYPINNFIKIIELVKMFGKEEWKNIMILW